MVRVGLDSSPLHNFLTTASTQTLLMLLAIRVLFLKPTVCPRSSASLINSATDSSKIFANSESMSSTGPTSSRCNVSLWLGSRQNASSWTRLTCPSPFFLVIQVFFSSRTSDFHVLWICAIKNSRVQNKEPTTLPSVFTWRFVSLSLSDPKMMCPKSNPPNDVVISKTRLDKPEHAWPLAKVLRCFPDIAKVMNDMKLDVVMVDSWNQISCVSSLVERKEFFDLNFRMATPGQIRWCTSSMASWLPRKLACAFFPFCVAKNGMIAWQRTDTYKATQYIF